MKKLIALLFWGFIWTTHCVAQVHFMDTASTISEVTILAKKGEWETVKQGNGVTIKYRSLKFDKSVKTRELSAHFVLEAHPDSVVTYLQNPKRHLLWNKSIKSLTILEQDSLHWVSHSIYNIPFPISQQDLVSNNTLIKTDHQHIIHITSKPKFIPDVEDIDRVKHYIAKWTITRMGENKVDITFTAITLSKSYIPKFIKDPIIQNNFLKSFKALKKVLNPK